MSFGSNARDLLWFSQVVNDYDVLQFGSRRKFVPRDRVIKLDWDNCNISIAGIDSNGKVRFVIRSKTNRNSDYMGHIPVQLRFMLEIEIDSASIAEPAIGRRYSISASRKNLPQSVREQIHDRWIMRLGDKAEVWEWTQSGMDIRSSKVYALYQSIQKFLDARHPVSNIIDGKLRIPEDKLDEIVPVVYQPAVDSLNNFLREMHCMKTSNPDGSVDVEVSLLFNNEQLRKFKLADGFYRWLRKLLYGRLIDIETFKIHFVKDDVDKNYFVFEGIYSDDYDLEYDTIHGDKPPAPNRQVDYYFDDRYHPIVFVNTSNHAMAPHDNNGDLWKWEYVSWFKGAPIVFGTNSRKEIERNYRSIFDRLFA